MEREQVQRLDHAHVVERDMEILLGQGLELTAAVAGDAKSLDLVSVGPFDGAKNVGAVARAADGDEQIARLAEILELLDEDAFEIRIVGPGEDVRRIVGQAEDAE